jgi:fatty acid desaturase
MHDASHGSVAPRNRALNDAVGLLASAPFMFQYHVFRKVHLAHHRHTNEGKAFDPDHYASEPPWGIEWLMPLRWATVFFWYNSYVTHKATSEGDKAEAAEWESCRREICVVPPVFVTSIWWVFGWHAVQYWALPFVLATTWLMYVFDYVPHRPYLSTAHHDPFRATNVTSKLHPALPGGFLTSSGLSVLLLFQNYHNIHHLYPFLPFYRYVPRPIRTHHVSRQRPPLPPLQHTTAQSSVPFPTPGTSGMAASGRAFGRSCSAEARSKCPSSHCRAAAGAWAWQERRAIEDCRKALYVRTRFY